MIRARPPAPSPTTFLGFYWARPGLQKYWTNAQQIDSDNGRLLAWLLSSRKIVGKGAGGEAGSTLPALGPGVPGVFPGARGGAGAAPPHRASCPRSRRRPAGGPAREP